MLDQNTDRMWYVIGAVIVGAAIIFLVNSSFPQLFASVGDTFINKTEDTSKIIQDMPIKGKSLLTTSNSDFKQLSEGWNVRYGDATFTGDSVIIPSGVHMWTVTSAKEDDTAHLTFTARGTGRLRIRYGVYGNVDIEHQTTTPLTEDYQSYSILVKPYAHSNPSILFMMDSSSTVEIKEVSAVRY